MLNMHNYPRHSMYSIYAYIDPPNHPNVGKYGIHGVSGYSDHAAFTPMFSRTPSPQRQLCPSRPPPQVVTCQTPTSLLCVSNERETLWPRSFRPDLNKSGNTHNTQTLHQTAIFTYIGVVWGVNVGIYAIHGVSGTCTRTLRFRGALSGSLFRPVVWGSPASTPTPRQEGPGIESVLVPLLRTRALYKNAWTVNKPKWRVLEGCFGVTQAS